MFLSVTPTFGWQQMALFTEEQLLSLLAKSTKKNSWYLCFQACRLTLLEQIPLLTIFVRTVVYSFVDFQMERDLDFSACVCLSQITEKYRSRSQEGNHPSPFSSNCRFAAFSTGDRITAGGGCWSPKLTFMARLSFDSLCCRTILNPALMSNH